MAVGSPLVCLRNAIPDVGMACEPVKISLRIGTRENSREKQTQGRVGTFGTLREVNILPLLGNIRPWN